MHKQKPQMEVNHITRENHICVQASWNEVLMGFLLGMGDEPPVKFRLLPVAKYSNIGASSAISVMADDVRCTVL